MELRRALIIAGMWCVLIFMVIGALRPKRETSRLTESSSEYVADIPLPSSSAAKRDTKTAVVVGNAEKSSTTTVFDQREVKGRSRTLKRTPEGATKDDDEAHSPISNSDKLVISELKSRTSRHHPGAKPPISSSSGANEWFSDEKGELYAALIASHRKACRDQEKGEDFRTRKREPSRNPLQRIVGLTSSGSSSEGDEFDDLKSSKMMMTLSGQWNRFWIQSRVKRNKRDADSSSSSQPQCSSGDIYHVLLESNMAKVDVYRIYDLGDGLHEVHFYLRRRSPSYTVCVDLVYTQQLAEKDERIILNFDTAAVPRSTPTERRPSSENMKQIMTTVPRQEGDNPNRFQFSREEICRGTAQMHFSVSSGPEVTPPYKHGQTVSCAEPKIKSADKRKGRSAMSLVAHADMFRHGAWMRLPVAKNTKRQESKRSAFSSTCDGIYCEGDLRDLTPPATIFSSVVEPNRNMARNRPIKAGSRGFEEGADGDGDEEGGREFLADDFSQFWFWASDYCTIKMVPPAPKFLGTATGDYSDSIESPKHIEAKEASSVAMEEATRRNAVDMPAVRGPWNSSSSSASRGTNTLSGGLLDNQWILAWGDSTLKQPVTNFVEYVARYPTYRSYAGYGPLAQEDIPWIEWRMKKDGRSAKTIGKNKPGFFTYRHWDLNPAPMIDSGARPAFRVTMDWGGCPGVTAAPTSCPNDIGMKNTRKVAEHLATVDASPTAIKEAKNVLFGRKKKKSNDGDEKEEEKKSSSGTSSFDFVHKVPALVLLTFFHWRHPLDSTTAFVEQMENIFSGLLFPKVGHQATSKDPNSLVKPLIIWHGYTHHLHNSDMRKASGLNWPPMPPLHRHYRLVVEKFLEDRFKKSWYGTTAGHQHSSDDGSGGDTGEDEDSVFFLDRTALTAPLRFGDRYGQFGVHYGNTHGQCLTGRPLDYSREECKRDTLADDMLGMMWLNLLAATKV